MKMAGAQGRYETENGKHVRSSRSPLHNFIMPIELKWGRPSSKPATSSRVRSPILATDHRREGRPSSSPVTTQKTLPSKAINSEVEAVREKKSDRLNLPSKEENKNKEKKPAEEELPWNLRTRRNVGSSRSPLHNFILPTELKWGRPFSKPATSSRDCSPILATDHHRDGRASSSPVTTQKTLPTKAINSEVEAVREKRSDRLNLPSKEENKNKEKKPAEEGLPWNLRPRRNVGSSSSPLKGLAAMAAAGKGEASGDQPSSRPRFSLTLTKEEIEEDFLKLTGAKPPKRPKRRPKNLQKRLDALFPGMYLTEVTPDRYAVSDRYWNLRFNDQGRKED